MAELGYGLFLFQRLGSIFDEYKGTPREANLLIYSIFFTQTTASLLYLIRRSSWDMCRYTHLDPRAIGSPELKNLLE